MKCFFDLLWLRDHQSFTSESLGAAIRATFARRGTEIPSEMPLALTSEFGEDASKNLQWDAFVRKGKLDAPALPEAITRIAEFLLPLFQIGTLLNASYWHPDTGWTTESP